MVMLLAGATRAGLIAGLLLALSVVGTTPIQAQDEASPVASDSAPQDAEAPPEPKAADSEVSEAADSETTAATEGAKPGEVAPEVAPLTSESLTSESPPSESPSSTDNEADVDSEAYKKKGRARAKASAALAGLVILGFAMVGLTWLGARLTRRYMFGPTGQPQPTKPTSIREDDWAGKPLPKRTPPPDDKNSSTSG